MKNGQAFTQNGLFRSDVITTQGTTDSRLQTLINSDYSSARFRSTGTYVADPNVRAAD